MTVSAATGTDPLGELSRRKGMNWRTYVIPDARVMFVQVNKNACTSLKWMMAGIAGEQLAGFGPGIEASTNRFDDIHDRRQWTKTPRLDHLDPGLRSQIHPDNGWFVFGVTRDPRSRLFSAWQSKLLLNNPGYYRAHHSAPWYPRHPITADTVVEDFAAFVTLFEQRPDIGLRRDGHFRDQVEMLHEDLVTYSEIYDLRELGRLKSELTTHLDAVGWQGELFLPRVNDTPLRANGPVFADGLRERIEKLYSADFARFEGRWDYGTIEAVADWTPEQLVEVDQLADHGLRLGVLLDANATLRSDVERHRARAQEQQQRADELSGRLRDAQRQLPWRDHLRADLRRVAAGVRRRVRSG